jgi:TetR/AcrR family transcriptional repressor of nem operon
MSRKKNTRTREEILQAACCLFHAGGFKGTSVDDVAREAGVKKANLFHYFPTKEDLGLAVVDRVTQSFKEKITSRLSANGKDPVRIVEKMFSESARNMKEAGCCRGCFIGNLAQELSDHNEKLRERIAEHFRFWTEKLSELLAEGQSGGYLRKEMKPGQSAEAILALYQGAMLFCKARKETGIFENARKMAVGYLDGFRT